MDKRLVYDKVKEVESQGYIVTRIQYTFGVCFYIVRRKEFLGAKFFGSFGEFAEADLKSLKWANNFKRIGKYNGKVQ